MVGGVQEYLRIEPGRLWIRDESGDEVAVPADVVVVCAGQEARDELTTGLQSADVPYAVVGGARDARSVDAVRATSEALEAVRRLAP